jgi:hypothetical protein
MVARMTRPTPNFVILDRSLLTVERLVAAMLQARDNCGRELPALDMHRGANVARYIMGCQRRLGIRR